MGPVAIGFGVVLVVLGVGSYLGTDRVSATALIPAYVGAALVVLGLLALREPWRKHAMHAAAVVGLLGCLGGLGRFAVVALRGDPGGAGALASLALGLLSGAFLALCVRSFIQARLARKRVEAQAP